MKFVKKALLISLLAASSGLHAAHTGTVRTQATFISSTCSVPASQMTRSVDIGTIEASKVIAASPGESLQAQDLNFTVTDCPAATKDVRMKFVFSKLSGTNYLVNNGDAKGVAMGITDRDDNLVDSSQYIFATDLNASAGTASINAKVHAYRTSEESAGGSINSSVNIFLEAF